MNENDAGQKSAFEQNDLVICLQGIRKNHLREDGTRINTLKSIDLQIRAGDFVAIRGISGSGKTTLLKILGLMDREFEGVYELFGHDISDSPSWLLEELRSERIGFVFQEGRFLEHLSIKDNVDLPLTLRNQKTNKERNLDEAEIFYSSEKLQEGILSRPPKELSGGEKQRAAIWRSIKHEPALILADEPTASLDPDLQKEIFKLFQELQEAGNTIVVISHDDIFEQAPTVVKLADGCLTTSRREEQPRSELPTSLLSGDSDKLRDRKLFWGFRPRSSALNLMKFAVREAYSRWIYLLLSVSALIIGIIQATVLLSVRDGTEAYIDNALQTGSRLTRIEVKPKIANRTAEDRFPDKSEIADIDKVTGIIERRETVIRVIDGNDKSTGWRAVGLHPVDPEYASFQFLAGEEIKDPVGLEAIVSANLLTMISTDSATAVGNVNFNDYIGQTITLELKQYSSQTVVRETVNPKIKIVGVIAHGEKGKQLYLPMTTLLVFEKWRRDREGREPIPLQADGLSWTIPDRKVTDYANFPWQDKLQIYVESLDDVLPTFRTLNSMRYIPESEIFDYQWVIDTRKIVVSALAYLVAAVAVFAGFIVGINIWSAAKIREAEFALYRLLGMRRGDLVFGQILSALIATLPAAAVGSLLGSILVGSGRRYLLTRYPGEDYAQIFAPIAEGILPIWFGVLAVTFFAALFPSLRVSNANPVKLLS